MQIQLENAGLYRDERWLVRGVSLSVSAGQIITLIGPNGAGKSTTIKMALGLEAPSEGTCQRAPNLTVGYVPQKLSLDWTMPLSVERFMRLTASLTDQQILDALNSVGLPDVRNAQMTQLSGGEFQRIQIARAIARRPQVLVLDEPAQGIDIKGEAQMYELIQTVRDELNCGVLLISHDLHVVMAATDTVICLNGHVCCHGSPSTVAEHPEYKALFATDRLAVYDHDHDHHHHHDGRIIKDHHHG